MKKVMAIILLILIMSIDKTYAQEKSTPMTDTMMRRDNMSVRMDTVPTSNMPVIKDNTPMQRDNMPMKMDTTPMQRDNMRRDNMPMRKDTIVDKAYQNKLDKTVNRMNRDTAIGGKYRDDRRKEMPLNGTYNGQKIRSDTLRNGAYNTTKFENTPNSKKKNKNKKELDGTQNGKYNYEMSRDSMPDAKNIDPYRKRYGSKYGDKMARNSTGMTDQKMRAAMAKEDRGVLMHRGRTMIVRNGHKTFINAYTYLSYGTKVTKDGTIIKQDGTKTMMKDGEFVNMMGEIVPMK